MNLKKTVLAVASLVVCCHFAHAQTFVRGADVSWCTEMEADGKMFYDANGRETEMMALLRQIGMNAVRLRVWVNPETEYGPWCDKADVLVKARRAHAQGLDLMIDFHYSDRFADPGQQNKPSAWAGLSGNDLKQALKNHTTDILQALKDEGIEPRWVQVGNETRPGMVFDDGKIDWNKSGSAVWNGYISLSNAGYEAVKSLLPEAKVIVHIDNGKDDNAWFFKAFKQYGGKFDMIGLSHYPDYTNWNSDNTSVATRIKELNNQFGVPVMLVETGYDAWDQDRAFNVMDDLFNKVEGLSGCAGVFYWEPEVYGSWRPAIYTTWGWGAYNKGAFTSQGRPGKQLKPFDGGTAGLIEIKNHEIPSEAYYDLLGRRAVLSGRRGIVVSRHHQKTIFTNQQK